MTLIMLERKRVKNVKLVIKPATTPIGRDIDCFPPTVVERIIGKTGRMQGDKIVTTPAKKAKTSNNIICNTNYTMNTVNTRGQFLPTVQ